MSRLIQSVIFEIRPRLQSCNVFIIPTNGLNITSTSLKINLKTNSILFSYRNPEISEEISEAIEFDKISFVPKSLSSLVVEQKYISFRVTIKSATRSHGSFRAEILNLPTNATLPVLRNGTNLDYLKQLNSLHCRNCTNRLSQEIVFDRVLPLPSDGCNPDDWFCHKSENSRSTATILTPKINDYFYTLSNFKINPAILLKSALHFDSVIFCKRCLAWLGTNKKNGPYFWNCTVHFVPDKTDNNDTKNALAPTKSIKELCFDSFKYSIINMINQTVGFICKILIECDVTSDKTEYLLCWVLDRKLNISLFENSPHTIETNEKIQLNDALAVKLLYKYFPNETDDVRVWQSDCNVQNLTVAYPMFTYGVQYLNKNADFMSKYSKTDDGFTISYIILDNC